MSPIRIPDKSGNRSVGDNGATVINAPTSEDPVDPYYNFATDNNTFDVPVGTVGMQIIIDVLTLQASTTLRIGTTNGGEQVVEDVETTLNNSRDGP